jgi:mono/diheme cytochrome c family protein
MGAFKTFPVLAIIAISSQALPDSARGADAYGDECGACHLAYPARLLSPPEWSRVLGDLEHHYGVDATIDAATLQSVARRLGVKASVAPSTGATLPRITAKTWFVDEHDEIGAATFRSPTVRSAGNCAACHADSARGDFAEDSVRLPR